MEFVTEEELVVAPALLIERTLSGLAKLKAAEIKLLWSVLSFGSIVGSRRDNSTNAYYSGHYSDVLLQHITKEESIAIHWFVCNGRYGTNFSIEGNYSRNTRQICNFTRPFQEDEKPNVAHVISLAFFILNLFDETKGLTRVKLKADSFNGMKGQIPVYSINLSDISHLVDSYVWPGAIKDGVSPFFDQLECDFMQATWNSFPKEFDDKHHYTYEKLRYNYSSLTIKQIWEYFIKFEFLPKIANYIHKPLTFCDTGYSWKSNKPPTSSCLKILAFIMSNHVNAQLIAQQCFKMKQTSHITDLFFNNSQFFTTNRNAIDAKKLLDYYEDNCRESSKAAKTVASLVYMLDDPDVFGPSFFHFKLNGVTCLQDGHDAFERGVKFYKDQIKQETSIKEERTALLADYVERTRKLYQEELPAYFDMLGETAGFRAPINHNNY